MSWTRRFIWAFWIFVITMLLWEFYQYNQKLSVPDAQHPTDGHYFFYQPKATAPGAPPAPAVSDGPDVEQTAFSVRDNTPGTGSITCYVTLTNRGKAKAVNIQVNVRPYYGSTMGDEDNGGGSTPVPENSPPGLLQQWISFPDLAPGASDTETAVFTKIVGVYFGKNPEPKILFEAEKK